MRVVNCAGRHVRPSVMASSATRFVFLFSALLSLHSPAVLAQAEKPKYGGSLSIATNSPTLAPLSWDPGDWNYKTAQDAGHYYDRLFVADFSKSKAQGGPYGFKSDSYLPSDAYKGDLAETWKWLENPLRGRRSGQELEKCSAPDVRR